MKDGSKVIGFECEEIILYGLPNLVCCKACSTFNYYAGFPPLKCKKCGDEMADQDDNKELYKHYYEASPEETSPIDFHKEVPLSSVALHPRTGTPITDAFREAIKDPKVAQDFADAGNALAATLQVASANTKTPPEEAPQYFTYDNFLAIDLRFGTVISAERLPKSKKLFKLMVDLGEPAPRQILAGIGETFETDAVIGKQYLFVANLPPRKMMGVESNGMILAAGEPASLTLVSPTSPVPAGARLK